MSLGDSWWSQAGIEIEIHAGGRCWNAVRSIRLFTVARREASAARGEEGNSDRSASTATTLESGESIREIQACLHASRDRRFREISGRELVATCAGDAAARIRIASSILTRRDLPPPITRLRARIATKQISGDVFEGIRCMSARDAVRIQLHRYAWKSVEQFLQSCCGHGLVRV